MTSLNSKRPYGSTAKLYTASGFLGVLPLPEGEKSSPPKGYTGGGRPHPTPANIAKWARERPEGNLALRLAEVPNEFLSENTLPAVYANNTVDGWELLGLDVDDYKNKKGAEQLRALENEYGALPATAMSSARWGQWPAKPSSIRIFLVPKGYRYMGKAAECIEIVQKRHRYMVAWPSTNPDANKALYEWRWGASNLEGYSDEDASEARNAASSAGVAADTFGVPLEEFEGGIPALADVAVLPEPWFLYLSRQGMVESDDPISSMTDDELWLWATESLRFESPTENEDGTTEGGHEPCRWMREAVEKYVAELDSSADSHPKLAKAHWRMLSLAAEGHSGLEWALGQYHSAWYAHVLENRGGAPEDVYDEITRSVLGCLSKIHPVWENKPLPDDTCAAMKQVEDGEWADRVNAWEVRDERIVSNDFGGLGPVVGKLLDNSRVEFIPKPADEYGRHDFGNGQHFVDLFGGNVKYVGARKSWILWSGERWHRDQDDRLIKRAYQAVRQRQERFAAEAARMAAEDPDDKAAAATAKSWAGWAKRSGDVGPVKNALEASQSAYVNDTEPVVLSATELDGNPVLIGCANGVINLMDEADDIDVRRPVKEDYVTYNTNVDYVPWRTLMMEDGKYHEGFALWQEYLDHFLPDPELQMFVRKVMGHMMIGENPEKKIVFLFGRKDTGKSTMLNAIKGALGDYYGTIDMGLFKSKDLNPGLVRAVPLRVTGMSEAEDASKTGVIDASVVKRLTGNDMVMAELKYSNEIFEGRPQFTTVIACNNPPKIANADDALYERLLVLPLDRQVGTAKRYERAKQIESESGTAVLAWLVEGWKDYRRTGLDKETWPALVQRANRIFTSQLNSVQQYIDVYLDRPDDTPEGKRAKAAAKDKAKAKGRDTPTAAMWPREWTPVAERVYGHYQAIAKKQGQEPVPMEQFTKDLGVGRTTSRNMNGKVSSVYVGIKFKEEPEDVAIGGVRRRF